MAPTLFARIAHPTDLTQEGEFAFYHALRLAVAAQARLDILHVDKDAHAVQWEAFPSIRGTLERWSIPLPEAWASNGNQADQVAKIAAYGTEPVHPLLKFIDENLPDLMVIATHRRAGLDRLLHREIAQKVARSRALPSLFVPYGDEGFVSPTHGRVHLENVLLPIDWLPQPQPAIDTARELVRICGARDTRFHLLHVAESLSDFPDLETPKETAGENDWTWHRETRSGDVVETILHFAENVAADLVVMVTQGHDGFLDALRGSTTERVLQGLACPLLAVPAAE